MTPVTCRLHGGNLRWSASMTLAALLICVDKAAAEVLHRVLEELGIRVELCAEFSRASFRLAQERFDAVIVDGGSNDEVINLLRDTRTARISDGTLAIAVVSGQEAIREMFSLGVNFVLYKPVAYDRALSSLRAARAVMRKEKRRNARTAVHAQATVDYANVQHEKATLVDVSHEGMQVRFGKKIPPTGKVYFQFHLPGQSTTIRLSGQVIWQDWNGRGGIQFVDVPKASRRLLTDFLSAHLPKESEGESTPGVTVEVEDPLQLATISVIEQTHGSEYANETIKGETITVEPQKSREASPAPKPQAADRDNRRNQARYACRIGAEVYRGGTSVPNHCCLTDLSSGGCYLEVPLPFPAGSSVEIVVRTQDMKLRLRGVVQASHPGYGMGIAFELKTKEEQTNVKKLTDFVAATAESSN
jgi:response regulator of citrate/malate metabolism